MIDRMGGFDRAMNLSAPAIGKSEKLKHPQSLGLPEFAALFGCAVADLPEDCVKIIRSHNFRYRVAEGAERDEILLGILKKIDSGVLSVAGPDRLPAWDKGWADSLEAFSKSGDVSQLSPKSMRPARPLRLNQQYIVPEDPDFETRWYAVFRLWLFRTYLKNASTIYEFGCGPGHNLPVLATLFPDKTVYGLDRSSSSVDVANRMSEAFGWKIEGRRFDLFRPDRSFKLEPGGIVLTAGALEQAGDNYEEFVSYLLDSKPALVVHVEPVVEWYDENNLVDYAALRFHRQRRYWEGFLEKLASLERQGRAKTVKTKRSYFGGLFAEGYSQIIWKPV